jgi:hypothetical protein
MIIVYKRVKESCKENLSETTLIVGSRMVILKYQSKINFQSKILKLCQV